MIWRDIWLELRLLFCVWMVSMAVSALPLRARSGGRIMIHLAAAAELLGQSQESYRGK